MLIAGLVNNVFRINIKDCESFKLEMCSDSISDNTPIVGAVAEAVKEYVISHRDVQVVGKFYDYEIEGNATEIPVDVLEPYNEDDLREALRRFCDFLNDEFASEHTTRFGVVLRPRYSFILLTQKLNIAFTNVFLIADWLYAD